MSPLTPQVSDNFVIIFESTPREEVEDIPYWTEVDFVAQISDQDLIRYGVQSDDEDEELSAKSWPKAGFTSKAKISRKLQSSTPKHMTHTQRLASRSVTFSPHIQIEPISPGRASKDASGTLDHDTPDAGPGDNTTRIHDSVKEQTLPETATKKAEGRYELTNQEVDLQALDPEMLDLLPPDFDVLDTNMEGLYVSSAGGDDHSDSVSYVSSEEEKEEELRDCYESGMGDQSPDSPQTPGETSISGWL